MATPAPRRQRLCIEYSTLRGLGRALSRSSFRAFAGALGGTDCALDVGITPLDDRSIVDLDIAGYGRRSIGGF